MLSELHEGRKRIVLQGSAGVGKTTLVNFLLKEKESKYNDQLLWVAAPTHKALSVLQNKIHMTEEVNNIKFCTVHSGLQLRLQIDRRTGIKSFQQVVKKSNKPFKDCILLVIDEASMLNKKMISLLEQYKFPIIFIGDNKQINPVKEVNSPVFDQNWYTIELTEIIRQGEGNPIIEISRNLPAIGGEAHTIGEGDDRTGFLYSNDRVKIVHKLAEANGTDELKYLAWTNAEVDTINFSVRQFLYGATPKLIEVGEVLVLDNRYVINKDNILQNNHELKIECSEIVTRTYTIAQKHKFEYKLYKLNNAIYALHEDSFNTFQKDSRVVKALAINRVIDWVDYYGFIEKFLSYKYNHAITVHKSQGSTYKTAIINVQDISRNRQAEERKRLLYTAVTRASNLVIFYKAPLKNVQI